jgi:hypothetical protein
VSPQARAARTTAGDTAAIADYGQRMAKDALVNTPRSFNRFYTQRVGLITDNYLGQRRTLTEARVLFDIGHDGVQVRDLRRALHLDSGFLSRTLRALTRDGLVESAPGGEDGRPRGATDR